MDAYSGNNQIPILKPDRMKTTFMTEQTNYQYNVMPFELRNACTTYQIMMNKVFPEEIWETLKVYIDDMIVNSNKEEIHDLHHQHVFKIL